MIDVAKLLVVIGLQSLRAHKTKSLIVGGLMAFGAFLVVTSLAVLGSVNRSTRQSVVESVSGDVQIYSSSAKDQLALLGGLGFGTEDIGEIDSYPAVKAAVEKLDNVRGIVPMGIANTAVSSPGDLDRALVSLRDEIKRGDDKAAALSIERVRRIAQVALEQLAKQAAVSNDVAGDARAVLDKAVSDAFWQDEFKRDPVAGLDWLDVKLAPLGEQGNQFYLRMVGTDLDAFKQTFSRIRVVEGEFVPSGTRGLLVGKGFLDRRLKNAVAMNLDIVNRERIKGNTIAGKPLLQDTIKKAQRASSRLVYLLPPRDIPEVAARVAQELRRPAPAADADLGALLLEFLQLDDGNFDRRYALFYELIAPRIQLYPFQVGDVITLTSFTKSGYLRSINVKVYGLYTIEGLETSDIASALTLSDMMTFRELYGRRTAALDAELLAMKAQSGAAEVAREDAEAALFGDTATVDAVAVQEAAGEVVLDKVDRQESFTFDAKQASEGFAISAAVLLKDPSQAMRTLGEINAAVEPLGLKAVDWQQATGVLGQMTMVISAILLGAIVLLFIVTIVILNNSLVMATLERVGEFGTLRAIGAQKRFITAMVVFETTTLGTLAGVAGALGGVLFVTWLHAVGVPAPAEVLEVLFGGPRLFPEVTAGNVVAALLATLVVGVFATLYPARLAVRVQPVVAMHGKE